MVVPGGGGGRPGLWSRSLCLEAGLQRGSMFPLIELAAGKGLAVVLLNPNANSVRVLDASFVVKVLWRPSVPCPVYSVHTLSFV